MSEYLAEGIFAALSSDVTSGSFYDDLGGRIYEIEAPHNASLPLCVVTMVSNVVTRLYGDHNVKELTFQIDLYGLRTVGARALGDINLKLFALLQGRNQTVTVDNHDRMVFTCINEGVRTMEEDAVRIMSEWLSQSTEFSS